MSAIGLVLFTLAWVSANHFNPWLCFQSESLALFSVYFLFIDRLLAQRKVSAPFFIAWIASIAFLPWLQSVHNSSFFAGDALLGSIYQIALLMAIMVGYTMEAKSNNRETLGWLGLAHAIWIAALVSAAIGLVQWFNLADNLGIYAVQTENGARAVGNLAQPNQLATLLLMGVLALVYVHEHKAIGKTGLILAVTIMTTVLALTQSRAGMVSVVAIATFLVWKQGQVKLNLPRPAALWWVGGFLLVTISLPNLSDLLLQGNVRSLYATESISERWLIWKQVAYAIGQAPWLGYGWNQTPAANAVGALAFPGSTTYTNAHNIILDLMVWCGIPLGLFLTSVMAYWMVSRMHAVKKPGAILAMAALLPIGVHSLLEFPFAYAYFLIAAGVFVGIVEAAHTPSKIVSINTRWLWPVIGIWACIGGVIVHEYLQIEEDFRIVRFENLRVGATPASYTVPQIWMLSHMAAMLKAARQMPKPGMTKVDLDNLHRTSDRFAYGAIRCKYAQALGLNGDPTGATRQMQIIHGMYGNFFYMACREELLRLTVEKGVEKGPGSD